MTHQRGFTLIELLVVIAVMSVLSSFILVELDAAREHADDATRKIALREIESALETYYSVHHAYPSTVGVCPLSYCGESPLGGNTTDWIPGLVAGGFIQALPKDPEYDPNVCPQYSGTWGETYLYISDGIDYKVLAHCPRGDSKITPTPTQNDPLFDPNRPDWAWQVSSPDAEGKGW